ncbi:unnamed protein product [Ixodes pacificus]
MVVYNIVKRCFEPRKKVLDRWRQCVLCRKCVSRRSQSSSAKSASSVRSFFARLLSQVRTANAP